MTNLLAKMEAELNCIPAKKSEILNNTSLSPARKEDELQQLESRRIFLRKLMQQYIKLQNQFMELTGKLGINY